MPSPTIPTVAADPREFDAVLFDFHSTLVDQGDPAVWLRAAWEFLGRTDDPVPVLLEMLAPTAGSTGHPDAPTRSLDALLRRTWDFTAEIDPENRRDLSPANHRAVYDALMQRVGLTDSTISDALYRTVAAPWRAYVDAVPVLVELRRRGVRVGLLSNVGIDLRPVLAAHGLAEHLDSITLSCEIHQVKPNPAAFTAALDALRADPATTLMVGDNYRDDGAAAAVGMRTLILPRTTEQVRGLSAVLRLVRPGAAIPEAAAHEASRHTR